MITESQIKKLKLSWMIFIGRKRSRVLLLYSAGLILTVKRKSIIFSRYISIYLLMRVFFFTIQPTALQTFTSLSRWWKTLRTWIVMEKTIQRSAENYYKFNVARKIQPSKCIIYLNHDDNLYQDHKCYLMVGTSKNMRMQHEDARGSRLGQL